jgi:hypothetical protein
MICRMPKVWRFHRRSMPCWAPSVMGALRRAVGDVCRWGESALCEEMGSGTPSEVRGGWHEGKDVGLQPAVGWIR